MLVYKDDACKRTVTSYAILLSVFWHMFSSIHFGHMVNENIQCMYGVFYDKYDGNSCVVHNANICRILAST